MTYGITKEQSISMRPILFIMFVRSFESNSFRFLGIPDPEGKAQWNQEQ